MLLDGPTGTRKTLTAEAGKSFTSNRVGRVLTSLRKAADKTKLPLMYLYAEGLGTESWEVGSRLSTALDLATEWDAVVLVDGIYRLCNQFLRVLTRLHRSGYFSRETTTRFWSS